MLEIARSLRRMAKRAGIIKSWAMTLGASLDEGFDEQGRTKVMIRAWCGTCRRSKEIDIVALAAKVGRDYSLLNRRCRCRLKPGCPGWNQFSYAYGRSTWPQHLVDEKTDLRWLLEG